MIALVRVGKSPETLAKEFEPSAQTIRTWVKQAARGAGERTDGLTTPEREEITRLRRENRQLRLEREILSKATGLVRQGDRHDPQRVYGFVRDHQAVYPIATMCRVLRFSPRASMPGTTRNTCWNLNGSNLPFVSVQVGADKSEITADEITIVQNSATEGSFTQLTTLRNTKGGVTTTETIPDAGTYTRNGTAVAFAFNSGDSGNGTVSGGTITVAVEGFSFVYRK